MGTFGEHQLAEIRAHNVHDDRLYIGRYVIEFDHDTDCPNPAEHDAGFPPIVAHHHEDDSFEDLGPFAHHSIYPRYPFMDKSATWVWRNKDHIFTILNSVPEANICLQSEIGEAQASHDDWPATDKTIYFYQQVEAILEGMSTGLPVDQYFTVLQQLWEMQGVTAFVHTAKGYSQGDEITMLGLYPTSYQRHISGKSRRPQPRERIKVLKHAMQDYAAWVWGNCWGYTISDTTGEDGDSWVTGCWGYIGDADHQFDGQWPVMDAALLDLAALIGTREGVFGIDKVHRGRCDMYRIGAVIDGQHARLLVSPQDEVEFAVGGDCPDRPVVTHEDPSKLQTHIDRLNALAAHKCPPTMFTEVVK